MSDWQRRTTGIALRCKYVFENKEMCDCEFIIGKKKVFCHKLILAMGSPVFHAMFFGEMAEVSGSVKIPDIDYAVFVQLLQYIYSDELTITSQKNACDVYNAAKKYLISSLVKECVDFLNSNLDISTVIPVYEFSKFHGEVALEKHCIKEIQLNTGEVVKTESFLEANEQTLSDILDFKCLNISSEIDLVQAIVQWAEAEKERRGGSGTPKDSPRPVVINLIKKLRFLTLTPNEFIDTLGASTVLTEKEKFSILSHIIRPDLPPMNLGLCEKKAKRRPCRSKCFMSLDLSEVTKSRCDGSEWLTSNFTINSRITLLGVELSLQVSNDEVEYLENIMIKVGDANSTEHFTGGSFYGVVKYNDKLHLMFTSKSILEPYKEYSIHTFLCIAGVYPIAKNNNMVCRSSNVEIEFLSHTSWERTHPWNTTVLTGIWYTDPLD